MYQPSVRNPNVGHLGNFDLSDFSGMSPLEARLFAKNMNSEAKARATQERRQHAERMRELGSRVPFAAGRAVKAHDMNAHDIYRDRNAGRSAQ